MEQFSMSAPQQQQSQSERQRPYSVSPQHSADDPPFTNVLNVEPQRERSYGTINEEEKKLDFIPKPVIALLGSTYCFITLAILLIFPILEVAIGSAYRDQCTINPNIPTYLVVTGSCGIASIVLTLAVVGAFIWCVKQESIAGSFALLCLMGLVFFLIFLMGLFLFAWFIVGNVWIFGAKNNVVYDDILSPNYCHRTLYEFAFTILILSYVLPVVSCCVSCFRACCQGTKALKSETV